jgi:hypothetical protein
MEKLETSVSSDFEDGLQAKEEEDWLNVNVAMKPSLLKFIEEALEDKPFSSRSRLIRRWIREKAEAEIEASNDFKGSDEYEE